MHKVSIDLHRVQTFIFAVPRLKAMLGANALIGHTMRHVLAELVRGRGTDLLALARVDAEKIRDILKKCETDPLTSADPLDNDDPLSLYSQGIMVRDGGRFSVVFDDRKIAEEYKREALEALANFLPGIGIDNCRIESFSDPIADDRRDSHEPNRERDETYHALMPQLQICQETGNEPSSFSIKYSDDPDENLIWASRSVSHRIKWGLEFRKSNAKTKDIISLLHTSLYPESMRWVPPENFDDISSNGYIAMICADGNRVGLRYKNHMAEMEERAISSLEKQAHGEKFFYGMRVAVRKALILAVKKTFKISEGYRPFEVLMLGGDDLVIVCRADMALKFATEYARALSTQDLIDGEPLHVSMGVAIAKKNFPISRMHEFAEILNSSGKRLYRSLPNDEKCSTIDWEIVTQSKSLSSLNDRQRSDVVDYNINGDKNRIILSKKPYKTLDEGNLEYLIEQAEAISEQISRDLVGRASLRGLRERCEKGRLSGEIAFSSLPKETRFRLGSQLWRNCPGVDGITSALDIIEISEIGRLGKSQ